MLGGDVGQRGLVAFDIVELSPLAVLEVEHQHAKVIGGHPEVALAVAAHLPDKDVIGHVLEAACPHEVCQRGVPVLLTGDVDIGALGVGDDPDIVIAVNGHPIVVVGIEATLDVVLLPEHLTCLAVDAHQLAIGRDEYESLLALGACRHAKLLGELMGTVAEVEVVELLARGVIVIETVVGCFHPVVLLRVDVDIFQSALDALLVEPACRRAVDLLGGGVKD